MAYRSGQTPVGDITLFEDHGCLVGLLWGSFAGGSSSDLLQSAWAALETFFAGTSTEFAFPIRLAGTPFQNRVWSRLAAIPYGDTMTYGSLAQEIASSPRAVAGACAANPLPIIIPCHRVIGHAGALTGYSGRGGIQTKERLLALESTHSGNASRWRSSRLVA